MLFFKIQARECVGGKGGGGVACGILDLTSGKRQRLSSLLSLSYISMPLSTICWKASPCRGCICLPHRGVSLLMPTLVLEGKVEKNMSCKHTQWRHKEKTTSLYFSTLCLSLLKLFALKAWRRKRLERTKSKFGFYLQKDRGTWSVLENQDEISLIKLKKILHFCNEFQPHFPNVNTFHTRHWRFFCQENQRLSLKNFWPCLEVPNMCNGQL